MAESFEPDSAIASMLGQDWGVWWEAGNARWTQLGASLLLNIGLTKRKRLRPNAIPTIFERPRQPLPSEPSGGPCGSSVNLYSRKRVANVAIEGASGADSKPRTSLSK